MRSLKLFHFILAVSLANSLHDQTAACQEQEVLESNEEYIDQLIDPNIKEDTYFDASAYSDDKPWLDLNILHELNLVSEIRKDSFEQDETFNSGLSYRAHKRTGNYGNLLLSLNLLNQPDGDNSVLNSGEENNFHLGRYELRQDKLPLTSSIYMNNYLGIHNPSLSRFANHFGRTSRRFNVVELDILGITSQFVYKDSTVALSRGSLGLTGGALLPRFDKTEGKVNRLQLSHALQNHFFTLDYWGTSDFNDQQSNTDGYRFSANSRLSSQWSSNINALGNDDSLAFLIGAEQEQSLFSQDFGAYYFQPDIIWINRTLGDDYAGTYYAFRNNSNFLKYAGSAEFRKNGLEEKQNAQDSLLLNLNTNYRLSRKDLINSSYRFRKTNDRDNNSTDSSFDDHRLQLFLNENTKDSRNSYRVIVRKRLAKEDLNDFSEYTARYSKDLNYLEADRFGFSLEYTLRNSFLNNEDNFLGIINFQKSIAESHSLRASIGYNITQATRSDRDGLNANLNYEWNITDSLLINARLNYNRNITRINNEATDFLTETEASFEEEIENYDLNLFLNIQYVFGKTDGADIIGSQNGAIGYGTVRGVVFLDENGDGIAQAGEKRLPNLDIFLDKMYPTKTDEYGEYIFRNVGIGKHELYIDEGNLPLPLSLSGIETYPIEVELRSTTTYDIAVNDGSFY